MLRVKASSIIRPAKPTPRHRLWLSDLDLIQAFTHTLTVYFYRPTTTTTCFFSPDIMKNALSKTLVHFYPLAGQLSYDETGRLELDCNEAGAVFYEAECDAEIEDFGDFKPTPELKALVPSVDYHTNHPNDSPLLLVQLTAFRCGGISISVAVRHTVLDGTSAAHFVSTWAKIARTGELDIDTKPFFDRTALRARDHPPAGPTFDHEEYKAPPQLLRQEEDGDGKETETTFEMFKFTSQQVNTIKQAANVGRNGAKISRFKSVVAHLWNCTCMARGLHADQMTKLYFSVDGRKHLQPPLPEGYFGNAVFMVSLTARSGDLLSGGVGHTAGLIEEATARMTRDEYMRSSLEFLNGQSDLAPFRRGPHTLGGTEDNNYGLPNLAVTSWLRIPFHDADFGWGRPVHMGPAAVGFEGKVLINATAEDDGSLVIALCLRTQHMDGLKELLYHGL